VGLLPKYADVCMSYKALYDGAEELAFHKLVNGKLVFDRVL
jgi:hypothetical protein